MTVLLDSNVLIALLVAEHVHHDSADTWFAERVDRFATCPITEGSAIRMMIREGESAEAAREVLTLTADDQRHVFWPDDISYRHMQMPRVIGHRQVTDAYLAELARAQNGRLATFDRGLAAVHHDVVELVPTTP